MFLPLGDLSQYIFGSLLFLLSLFIIAIILLQRGKGGGLTGALGGLGGQSAFGVKAGDIFTRITAIAVLMWIFTCALACRWYKPEGLDIDADISSSSISTGSNGFGPGFEGIPSGNETGDVAPARDASAPDAVPPPVEEDPATKANDQ